MFIQNLINNFCHCGENFWNYDLMWNTETPRFTRCFLKLLPVLGGAAFLSVFGPFEIYLRWNRNRRRRRQKLCPNEFPTIPINTYNVSRLVSVAVIVAANLVSLVSDYCRLLSSSGTIGSIDSEPPPHHRNDSGGSSESNFVHEQLPPTNSDIFSAYLHIFTFLLFGTILEFHRRIGAHTSALAWLFTFIYFVLQFPTLYMLIVHFYYGDSDHQVDHLVDHHQKQHFSSIQNLTQILPNTKRSIPIFGNQLDMALFIPQFIASFALLALTCFADNDNDRSENELQNRKSINSNSNKVADISSHENNQNNLILNCKNGSPTIATASSLLPAQTCLSKCLSSTTATISGDDPDTPKRLSIAPEAAGRLPGSSAPSPATESPEFRSSFLSQITFWWFTAFTVMGYRKALTVDDLWLLNAQDSTARIAPRCDRNWIRQMIELDDVSRHYDVDERFPNIENLGLTPAQLSRAKGRMLRRKPDVLVALYRTFGLSFWRGNFFKFIYDVLQFVSPFLLKIFIDFFAIPGEPIWHGYVWTCLFFFFANIESCCLNYYFYRMYRIGARVQTALISAIYRKSLQMSNNARRETTMGEIVNLMTVDAQRFVDLMPYINLLWSSPLKIMFLIYFIYLELGVSVFAGVAVMAAMVPLNWYITAYQRKLQLKQMLMKDERVKVIGEILVGIRVIKLYGWEYPFIRKVTAIRDREIVQLREIAYMNTISQFLWTCTPFLVSFATFAVFVLSSEQHVLDAKKAFVSLSLFSLMQFPLSMLPRTITSAAMLSISVKRVNRFCNSAHLQNYVQREFSIDGDDLVAISIVDGYFCWETIEESQKKSDNSRKSLSERCKKNLNSIVTPEPDSESSSASSNENGASNQNGNLATTEPNGKNWISKIDCKANFCSKTKLRQIEEDNFREAQTIANSTSLTLHGINLQIRKGSLVAIVGMVGSGKSSLLAAILGDIERIAGSVRLKKCGDHRCDGIAYVAQQAWIRNATLRENVLFGNAFDQAKYESIIDMCALQPDIAILPGGDEAEIGEKGINLSGGQKQRVAIARACYSSASIVLFDDPLSAVDSHVARHIFQRVIANGTGYLADRTRVFVTNNVALLPEVDEVVVLAGGTIIETGTYAQLMKADGGFAKYIREYAEETQPNRHRINSESFRAKTNAASVPKVKFAAAIAENLDDTRRRLIHKEHTEIGEVKASVYLYYFRSLSYFWLAMIFAGYIGIQIASIGSSVWLAMWSNANLERSNRLNHSHQLPMLNLSSPHDSHASTYFAQEDNNNTNNTNNNYNNQTEPVAYYHHQIIGQNFTAIDRAKRTAEITSDDISARNFRLAIFALFGVAQGIFVFLASIAKEKAIVRSSVSLHRSLLESIMHSPMQFFDTTPLGRIVNRFSKDIDAIDHKIPHTIHSWLMTFLQVILTLILIVAQVPRFMFVVLPIVVLYHYIQKFYVSTSRQLKRLESVTRSPIYSHFGETLSGVSTIRAFGSTRCFIGESNYRVDTNQRCYYPSFIDNRWLAIRLEFCGNLVVFFTAILSVAARESFASTPGYVGLIITYALNITQTLNWLVRMTSEMETNVVSVERIGEYCEIPPEREWRRAANVSPAVAPTWPADGAIDFIDYSVRYREGLDLVLNRVNISIGASEKIGIVGRTGSGKSTLTLALFRILEPAAGSILIDGVDICKIGLHELRCKLSIIPQDPVLFSGTIRSNLDPFGVYSDELIWETLENCHLRTHIASLDAGLSYQVAENGANLSLGQRQLICLGRALLRRAKILVLDEATAAIDLETDALIQATIRQKFSDCTVLCIAHRLHTVLDSDKVLVLDKGSVVEFDSPDRLLANVESSFYALAKDAGIVR